MFYQQQGMPFFKLWGIQVSVGIWYLLVLAMMVFLWPALSTGATMIGGLVTAIAVTLALLIHDFAHALVAKRQKLGPSIILTAFGGYTITERESATDGEDARVVFAGPVAGMVLAGAVALLTVLAPTFVASSAVTHTFFSTLLWFSLIWSVVNLVLPVWPLDGGRLFHLFLRRIRNERQAREWTLKASLLTLIPLAILGFLMFSSLIAIFFALFVGMENYRALQSGTPLVQRRGRRQKTKASGLHAELLAEAEQAMANEDWAEAARLGHHMRSLGSMPAAMVDKVWTIIGVATMRQERYEEALRYLRRAPQNRQVKEAIETCEAQVEE